jgi:hypothetical protein
LRSLSPCRNVPSLCPKLIRLSSAHIANIVLIPFEPLTSTDSLSFVILLFNGDISTLHTVGVRTLFETHVEIGTGTGSKADFPRDSR